MTICCTGYGAHKPLVFSPFLFPVFVVYSIDVSVLILCWERVSFASIWKMEMQSVSLYKLNKLTVNKKTKANSILTNCVVMINIMRKINWIPMQQATSLVINMSSMTLRADDVEYGDNDIHMLPGIPTWLAMYVYYPWPLIGFMLIGCASSWHQVKLINYVE